VGDHAHLLPEERNPAAAQGHERGRGVTFGTCVVKKAQVVCGPMEARVREDIHRRTQALYWQELRAWSVLRRLVPLPLP
jgi:hypothetical protein